MISRRINSVKADKIIEWYYYVEVKILEDNEVDEVYYVEEEDYYVEEVYIVKIVK